MMENKTTNGTAEPTPVKRKKHTFLTVLGILFALLCIAVCAVFVYPAPILRYVCSHIEAQTGIAVTFDKAHVYLDFEKWILTLGDLTAKRQNHLASNFDVQTEKIEITITSLDFKPMVAVSGLRGMYERSGNDLTDKTDTDKGEYKKEAVSEKNYMKILYLCDTQVDFIDRTLEKPFHTMIQIEEFCALYAPRPSLFEPYACTITGQISSAEFGVRLEEGKQKIVFSEVPLGLFAPYAPVLDDIFIAGSMNIKIDDLSDETQKKLWVAITLLPDCRIKSADEILAPAIQAALQKLDHSSVPALQDLKGKIERLKMSSVSLRTELDKVAQIIDTLKILAPRDVREKYENFKSRYDQITNAYDEWNTKFETLLHDLDKVKTGIVNNTFRHFVESGIPIEAEVQQINGEWQCDWYEMVVHLVEKNYQTIITTEYQKRIQEIRDSVDRLLAL